MTLSLPRPPVRLVALLLAVLSLGVAPASGQGVVSLGERPEAVQRGAAPTLRVVERSATGVTYEFSADWRLPLRDVSQDNAVALVTAAVGGLPILGERLELPGLAPPTVTVLSAEFDEAPLALGPEAAEAAGLVGPPAAVEAVGLERRRPVGTFAVRTLVADPEAGVVRRYRRLRVRVTFSAERQPLAAPLAAENPHLTVTRSALAEGTWFRIPVTREGVYRVDRALIAALGLNPDAVDPDRVQVFGNGGAPLPALNSAPRIPDLAERPRLVVGGGDGQFGPNDGVFFWASGPTGWRWDTQEAALGRPGWRHYINPYSQVNYVFLRVDGPAGRTHPTAPAPGAASATLERVTGRVFREEDHPDGMIDRDGPPGRSGSGLDWLGRSMTRSTPLLRAVLDTIPDGFAGGTVQYRARVAAASSDVSAGFAFLRGEQVVGQATVGRIFDLSRTFFNATETRFSEEVAAGQPLRLDLRLSAAAGNPTGWIDYVQGFYPQDLRAVQDYLRFATPGGQAGPFDLLMGGFSAEPQVWDVTEPGAERRLPVDRQGDRWRARVAAPDPAAPREIVAFVPSTPRVRRLDGRAARPVPNQNLHGIAGYPDYVIVTAEPFRAAAERLAARRAEDGLTPLVVDIEQVFNEFGGGLPDPRALRDYFRFLYDRGPGPDPAFRLALLFGSGHYDHRNIRSDEPNWIPTYQTENSASYNGSYTSDDYFGLLDPNEGVWTSSAERLDIGIGRLPVHTPQEADEVVRKIERYEDPATAGAWRTRYTVLADDHIPQSWDKDLHVQNAEAVADTALARVPGLNVEKIYLATYPLQQTAVGARYPAATADAIRGLEDGRLLWNYSGHGNPNVLADERLITREQIRALNNFDRLTIAVTATCSFGRYDIAGERSGGEEFVLNPNGGAIAIFTTVREVYTGTDPSANNLGLNLALNRFLLAPDAEGRPRRLGEAYHLTKASAVGAQLNNRKFNLLGDPGMRLGLPERPVRVTEVNGIALPEGGGTDPESSLPELRALEEATVRGEVRRLDGALDPTFQGEVEVIVYDVPRTLVLPPQVPLEHTNGRFLQRTDVIYRGRASVRDGAWEARFIVPRDVSYAGGPARISAYVADGAGRDGQGFSEAVRISTEAGAPLDDREGPRIRLFLNDTTFVSGGLTGSTPVLIARLEDQSGINMTGAGVGHEMRLVVNGDQANAVDVSSYYQSDLDTFRRGTLRFPMPDLPQGPHTVTLTAWDVVNNASTATLDFVVEDSERLRIAHAYPYPNPTTGPTRFVFEHNQAPGTPARVQIRIYTLAGRPVRTLDGPETLPDGLLPGSPVQVPWDGRDEDLDTLATGIYLYKVRVEVERPDGERRVAEEVQRLAIIR